MARLLDPRNGSAFDLPSEATSRTYVIASTPRSGSTLLARMIWDHGGAGAPKEYLNPMQLRDWEVRFGNPLSQRAHRLLAGPLAALAGRRGWSETRIEGHLQRVRQRRTSGGWFGLKLHWHHHQRFFTRRALEEVLGDVMWIRIQRRDPLAQAVSWELALQTGRWVQEQKSWRHPIYQRRRITARLADLDAANAGWSDVIGRSPCIQVVYEDLARDPARSVRRTLDALGVPTRPMPAPSLRPMGSPQQVDWMERYRRGD